MPDTLTVIGQTSENVIFDGSLADCQSHAAKCGLEVERYEGRIISSEGRHAVYAPATENHFAICWFKPRGLILKGRDSYTLVVPRS